MIVQLYDFFPYLYDFFPVHTEMFDLKVKYDESDHVVVRATRAFTDKIGHMFGESHILHSLIFKTGLIEWLVKNE